MLDDVCCGSQLVLSLHLRFVSCNGFKFGNLGISLSGDIERVKRVFLSTSSYAGGVSVLQWCRFGTSSRVSIYLKSLCNLNN